MKHHFKSRLSIVFGLAVLSASIGCVGPSTFVSTVGWNLSRVHAERVSCTAIANGLKLAKKSPEELEKLMSCRRAPCPGELVGTWYGINKGVGAAAIGLHQDVKVIERNGNCLVGHNVLVEQVAIHELVECGWLPKRSMTSGEVKTMGNFVVLHGKDEESCRRKVELDYSLAENPSFDPTRYLVDELVEFSPGLLLGKAHVRIGTAEVKVAYFVLMRLNRSACGCKTEDCDGNASLR